jgi:Flp pilus assembly protein TadG
LRGDDSGATALEFALIVPVAVTCLVGMAELGWGLHLAATVRWTLEQEARTLLLNPNVTAAQLKTAMVHDMAGVANPQSLTVTLATDSSDPNSKVINATSAFTYALWIPFVPTQTLNFTATTSVPTL